jgi:hypothetical protein
VQGNQVRNTDEMIPYDGDKAAKVATYNFCYLCKDRLDVVHDEFDEGWYFVGTKQIRIRTNNEEQPEDEHNVHAVCLKELELNDRQKSQDVNAKIGGKRPRVYERAQVAEQKEKLESMIASLEADKKRRRLELEV